MIKYKLTNQGLTTRGGCKWEIGKWKETDGSGYLCGPGYLHYYHHPLLAVLLNAIHGDIINPRLFEIEAEGKHLNDVDLKGGCTKMRLIRELELPEISPEQCIAICILVTMKYEDDNMWNKWAVNWLANRNRNKSKSSPSLYLHCGEYAATETIDLAYSDINDLPISGMMSWRCKVAQLIAFVIRRYTIRNSLNLVDVVLMGMKNEDPDYEFKAITKTLTLRTIAETLGINSTKSIVISGLDYFYYSPEENKEEVILAYANKKVLMYEYYSADVFMKDHGYDRLEDLLEWVQN